jgi:uncharacterized protein YgiM (DUF1202 family)
MLKDSFKNKIIVGLLSLVLLLGTSFTAITQASVEDTVCKTEIGIKSIHYHVTASVLNIRSGPGLSYSIVGQVYRGDTVWYHSSLGSEVYSDGMWWTPIYKDSLEGWAASQYLEEY